ncbi:MAG: CO dehydrogenase/CO-methylating acetyl-CoA synthase complex subunit beta [Candidatus Omnitrophica bacterium]|nr:CO dehydrogenase/CO-methylating acetyl-CoA synthase complex subunit beta [Candidatus Omnitrophota bacterium]
MPRFIPPEQSSASVDIPVPYSFEFEGERVRREDLQVEFGGEAGLSFELLTSKKEDEINDWDIEVIGPDIDQLDGLSSSFPLAVIINVYGRKMQNDFEPVLERHIHRFINYAFGVMHSGQRDTSSIRVSRNVYLKGFRLKHIGIILSAMLHKEYSAIVDKVEVRIYTKKEDVERLLGDARKVFAARDKRLSGKTDESVDTYYSCLICQSLAPNHVCIITPERTGLCGAYSWLDAKASFEIVPTGPNQPILKGRVLDKRLGQWGNVNKFVKEKSNRNIKKVSIYSLIDSPMSSSALLESIVAVVPEANGVMVVSRNYPGLTPLGISFKALAEPVGTGVQTPGFLGISNLYILSRKFILAEGGIKRLVWMPKELKGLLAERLSSIARDIGEPDLLEQIADEGVAGTLEELLSFLSKAKHPALYMDPLI